MLYVLYLPTIESITRVRPPERTFLNLPQKYK